MRRHSFQSTRSSPLFQWNKAVGKCLSASFVFLWSWQHDNYGLVNGFCEPIVSGHHHGRNRVFAFSSSAASLLNDNNSEQEQDVQRISFSGGEMEFSWHTSIGEIPLDAWDSCLPVVVAGSNPQQQPQRRSPFLEHAWLHSLEESGCACKETGWIPSHLSIQLHTQKKGDLTKSTADSSSRRRNGVLQDPATNQTTTPSMIVDGCVPVYIKTHSMGEFIFDDSWADAAYRIGLDYYPKLLVGVPFTPVTGPRFMWQEWVWDSFTSDEMDELNRAVGDYLRQSALNGTTATTTSKENESCLSSIHINFCTDQEATALAGPLEDSGLEMQQIIESVSSKDTTTKKAKPKEDTTSNNDDNNSNNNNQEPITKKVQTILRQFQQRTSDTQEMFLRRTSLQYHWKNRNPLAQGRPFLNFDDYLSCFRSKRRISIRRERSRARQDGTIQIDAIMGTNITKVEGLVERMFEIYVSTVDKLYWGRQYLTLEFFQRLCQTSFVHNLCFLCVRYQKNKPMTDAAVSSSGGKSLINNGNRKDNADNEISHLWKAEDVFAGTLNVIKDGVFYGRYWGCLPDHEAKNLHFETCYWSAIDYCIEHGLERMEPGAGGGDYKWARGFDPQLIHSVHYICNPWLRRAVCQFLESETEYNMALMKHLLDRSSVAAKKSA